MQRNALNTQARNGKLVQRRNHSVQRKLSGSLESASERKKFAQGCIQTRKSLHQEEENLSCFRKEITQEMH
jgi:hypothetical protein